jgi:hypothetical protein
LVSVVTLLLIKVTGKISSSPECEEQYILGCVSWKAGIYHSLEGMYCLQGQEVIPNYTTSHCSRQ